MAITWISVLDPLYARVRLVPIGYRFVKGSVCYALKK